MTSTPRLRFAPSPTGYLHVGGARTALFNWLYAKHYGGQFLLRIEDTDKARSTEESTRAIFDEIERRVAAADPFTIRFRVAKGSTSWNDVVHGTITFPNKDIDDFVVLRSDGTPIYNLAVVSDDIGMGITLVMRGDDHISNTPKQIMLYDALGAAMPKFAHLPMIHGPDGKKLSKRHGATAVADYQHMGILPQAMLNFLALLGWSPGHDIEIMSVDEMIRLFSVDGLSKHAAVFDMKKLEWMNGQHLSLKPAEKLLPIV